MRLAFLPIFLVVASATTAGQPAESVSEHDWCASIGIPGTIELGSRTLTEIPDVTDDSIRRLNLQLSSGCFREVREVLASRLDEIRDDPQLSYVLARFIWMTNSGHGPGEELITDLVERFPDFVSGWVLLAGLRFAQERYDEAAAILDGLGVDAQDRLWVYMGRLRIRAVKRTDDEVVDLLLQVLENDSFPPNARDAASSALRKTRYNDPDFQIPLYRIPLSYRSSMSYACKLNAYALLMTERLGRFAEAVETLEPYEGRHGHCAETAGSRMLLGYAYLVLAADIAAGPAAANHAYVDRADELLADGGYENLASFLLNRPRQALLEPFLAPHFDPEATDQYGRTRICNALMVLDAQAVYTELARGADPNGICGGEPLVVRLAGMVPKYRRTEQEHILRLLLQYGGKYENFGRCNPAVVDGCSFYLYPIFQEFGIE